MAAKPLQLYAVFHLNIAYSSIEELQRPEVIRRCYWPLLKLARKRRLPFGIEMPAYTLEEVARLDSRWVAELRALMLEVGCEFIGSGYAQIIGPLVPAAVNAANLRLGHETYERLLGRRPRIALVNEQAYSAGLVKHYVKAGYEAVIMEWDNPAKHHPEWDTAWRYLPQKACGPGDEEIALLWNKSIAFQKFQRYAHGEMELDEYVAYLGGHVGEKPRAFPLYANDVEIFDFRPGRYHAEAPLQEDGEWRRLEILFETLRQDPRLAIVAPSRVLDLQREPGAGNPLRLESADQPIPVKKQGKYNVVRWAVTGRDDVGINTACWRLYKTLSAKGTDTKSAATDEEWRELCFLWSSDFRTHVTDKRWTDYMRRLAAFEKKLRLPAKDKRPLSLIAAKKKLPADAERRGRRLTIRAGRLTVTLNCQRGLAVEGVWLDGADGPPLVGTLPHGFYDDISLGSDWYTGHTVLETPGQPKIADLTPVAPRVEKTRSGDWLVSAKIPTPLGPVFKTIEISGREPVLTIAYRFDWKRSPMGSLRLGNITLHPDSFDRGSLYYSVANGGSAPEKFSLAGKTVDHGASVSFLVSATTALGMTDGRVELGDARRCVIVESDQACAALVGMITYRETKDSYFCRLALSAGEMDETRRPDDRRRGDLECRVTLRFV